MNRNYWTAGLALLILLMIAVSFYGAVTAWNKSKEKPQGSVGARAPLPSFGYCSTRQTKPCILSINLDPQGDMLISVLTDSLQDFYIKIQQEGGEEIYECKRTRRSAQVSCTGKVIATGKMLSFFVISKKGNDVLAAGAFPIIGMALATPEVYLTPTPILFNHLPK